MYAVDPFIGSQIIWNIGHNCKYSREFNTWISLQPPSVAHCVWEFLPPVTEKPLFWVEIRQLTRIFRFFILNNPLAKSNQVFLPLSQVSSI